MASNLDIVRRNPIVTEGQLNNFSLWANRASLKIPDISENWHSYPWIRSGADNLFPEFLRQMTLAPLNGRCMELKADLAVGEGLAWSQEPSEKAALDEFFNNCIANNAEDYNINDFLRRVIYDYCCFGGYSFITKLNLGELSEDGMSIDERKRKVKELQYLPYESVRLGSPIDQFGTIDKVYYSRKWEARQLKKLYTPQPYALWNGNRLDCTQIYYNTSDRQNSNYYPLPSWYAAINYVLASIQMAEYMNTALENSFVLGAIIAYPYDRPSKEKDVEQDMLKGEFTGAHNGNKVLSVWGTTNDQGNGVAPQVTMFNANDNAGIYEATSRSARENICNEHGVPGILMGFSAQDKLTINGKEQSDAIKMMAPMINKIRQKVLGSIKSVLYFNARMDPRLTRNAIESLNFVDTDFKWE